MRSRGGPGASHFNLATTSGEPVDQYGLAHTLDMGRWSTFTRPLKPGGYVLRVYRGRPPRGEGRPATVECSRTFEIRTERTEVFKVEWHPRRGCEIIRVRG